MCRIRKILVTVIILNIFCEAQCAPKIGIVGGGIGGTSVAYFIKELFGKKIEIDIFEYNKVGGRIALENVEGCEYEAGGSIIHPKNKYMTDFLNLFNLRKRQGRLSALGLYDGEEFPFMADSDWTIVNTAKLFWHYGFGCIRVKHFIDSLLENFSRIYTLQEINKSFNTVEDMLSSMDSDFVKYLYVTAKDEFKNIGFSDKIVDELVLATLLVNYGQTTSVHEFVAAVSVAGAMPGLWAVQNGNVQIPLKLQEVTNSTVIRGSVTQITLIPNSDLYEVSWRSASGENKNSIYDIVIIATPLAKNMKQNIKFDNMPNVGTFPQEMHQTVATFLVGNLNTSYFGLNNSKVNEILSVNGELFFNSVGQVYPVDESKPSCRNRAAWKIFSHEPLRKEQLEMLFTDIKVVKSVPWLAYPKYSTVGHQKSFILNKNLYYVNAIEWAASAMEMSVISARNVALLAFKGWTGRVSNDSKEKMFKIEL